MSSEVLRKLLSLNTVCRCIKKYDLKLYYVRGRHLLILSRNAKSSMGPKSTDQKTDVVRRVHISACFWEKNRRQILRAKYEKTIQTVTNKKCKKTSHCDGMGVHQCLVICIYVKVTLMWRLKLEFWRDICCRQDDDFSQELHFYFSRTIPGLILHELQQCGFVGIECVCLTGLPAVQICLLLKMYGTS